MKEQIAKISRSMITCSHYNYLDDREFNNYLNSILSLFEAEYKERIKKLFERIEDDLGKVHSGLREYFKGYTWQSIKEKEIG